jgi:hypothetical protein
MECEKENSLVTVQVQCVMNFMLPPRDIPSAFHVTNGFLDQLWLGLHVGRAP